MNYVLWNRIYFIYKQGLKNIIKFDFIVKLINDVVYICSDYIGFDIWNKSSK